MKKDIAVFKQWMPDDIGAVFVKSAGRAIRVIELDKGSVYAGICLDHDLDEQVVSQEEYGLNGVAVFLRLVRNIIRVVPILVHSMNFNGGTAMVRLLQAQGFSTTRIPFAKLEAGGFGTWLEDVRSEWELSKSCDGR